MSNPENPEREMSEIWDIIPKVIGSWSEQPVEVRQKAIDYLQDPCVIEFRLKRIDGSTSLYATRVALGLRTQSENVQGLGIPFRGLDIELRGWYTHDELNNGETTYEINEMFPPRTDELVYIGRVSELDTPPQRVGIFNTEIKQLAQGLNE